MFHLDFLPEIKQISVGANLALSHLQLTHQKRGSICLVTHIRDSVPSWSQGHGADVTWPTNQPTDLSLSENQPTKDSADSKGLLKNRLLRLLDVCYAGMHIFLRSMSGNIRQIMGTICLSIVS